MSTRDPDNMCSNYKRHLSAEVGDHDDRATNVEFRTIYSEDLRIYGSRSG